MGQCCDRGAGPWRGRNRHHLLTDYPGSVAKVLSYERHGRIDATMSGTLAMLPMLLGLSDQKESAFFGTQALAIGTNASITDFGATGRRRAA